MIYMRGDIQQNSDGAAFVKLKARQDREIEVFAKINDVQDREVGKLFKTLNCSFCRDFELCEAYGAPT